ncbi:MAG TPA: hypothetical protein VGH95_02820 [Candidatus Aquirickettsiella sp.]|jgi:hypothetical protein
MSLLETDTSIETEASQPPSEGDTGWKSVLDSYFPRLLEFFYPHLYEKIDWTKDYQFLDKELQAITREAAVGKRCVDKLVRVNSYSGQQAVVLLHLEIQGQRQAHFAQRLFDYYCLLHLRYKQPIIVLAILTDDSPSWRPTRYQSLVWEQPVIHFSFYTNKLLDYRGQELILGENKNPFAWVVLAQLAAIETKQDNDARFQQKFRLVRRLYERDFSRDMVIALLTFMDWVLTLPEALEIQYNKEIKKIEEEHGMAYITSFERIGRQQGLQEGIQQGEYAILQHLLQRKFRQIPSQYLAMLLEANSETLLRWSEKILEAKSIAEVFEE